MPHPHPRLRSDLVVTRLESPEGPSHVLKDPRTRRFFRLREAEYSIARRLDGDTAPEAIARQVATELGADVDTEVVASFVEQLRTGGLLEAPADAPAPEPRRPFVQGDILWLRFRAFDPDRLLGWLVGKVRFCFTPWFVLSASALILWAFATVVMRHQEIQADLVRLWSLEILALAWVTIIVVTTLHEFAHGLTCKHFGGRVHEMGFLLIYLQPAFYCNISDAWLFPEKSKRMWVTFAGAFWELVVWALATLVWRLTERDTWASAAALVVMATSGFKLFFNLNPLIKLDGYYLLSDWLDTPNLRQRAFAYVGSLFNRLLGLRPTASAPEPSRRERGVLLAYGLVATTFSIWLLGSLLIQFGQYFTYRWHGWGAVLWSGLCLGVVGNFTGKSLLRWPKALSFRSHRARLLALAAGVLVVLHFVPIELRVGGEFEVAPARNTDVRAQVEGIIEAVYRNEGDVVAAGDTLARLSDRDYRARLQMAAAKLDERQAKLRLLQAGPRADEVQVARSAVAGAEERLRFAAAELERKRRLAATEAASPREVESAEETVAVLTRDLEGEGARLRILESGSRPEEVTAMRQEVVSAEAELRHLEGQVARLWVTAPHGGIMTTPKLRERIGELVKAGDLIAEVYALEKVTTEIAIPEQDIGVVQVGQRGNVRLRAYPERAFEGRVVAIAASAADAPGQGRRVVKTTIELPNEAGLIKPSMTGYARISCGRRSVLDVLTRGVRRFVRLEFWSWW